jgi:hypothetical protein
MLADLRGQQFIDQGGEQGQFAEVVQALSCEPLLVSVVLLQQIEIEAAVFVATGMSNSFPARLPPVLGFWHGVALRGG